MEEIITATVVALDEAELGQRWQAWATARWDAYRRWFLSEGESLRATYGAGRRALLLHMPELIPTYDRAVELLGGSDLAARCLSGYCLPPFIQGCSQAVFGSNAESAMLVRNYDYSPHLWEATLMRTAWRGEAVLGMSDCLIGLLDGINAAGLTASLAFGGRPAVGVGFGMPHILRYVLQVATRLEDAREALCRVPSHMAYNVTLLDQEGRHLTAMVGPDRAPVFTSQRVVTNHQQRVEWHRHAMATGTVDRLRYLTEHAYHPEETEHRFVQRFLEPPAFSEDVALGLGTLYTAVYRPSARRASYLWRNHRWDAGLAGPLEGELTIRYLPRPEK